MTEAKSMIINDIRNKLMSKIQPKSIILFGSFAKGTENDDSDIDLLVVWDEQKNISNVKRRILLRKIIGITENPVDILTCSSDELDMALADENSFTSQIIKEGEVIYDRLNRL